MSEGFSPARPPYAVRIASSGDNIILTPPPNQRLRLFWLGLNTPETNTAEVLAVVRFQGAASNLYRWNLGAPGAFMHRDFAEGQPGQPLVVNLSAAQPVEVNVSYEFSG